MEIRMQLDKHSLMHMGITSIIKAKINWAVYLMLYIVYLLQLYFGPLNQIKHIEWASYVGKYITMHRSIYTSIKYYYVALAIVGFVIFLTYTIFFVCGFLFNTYITQTIKQDKINSVSGHMFFFHFTFLRIPIVSVLLYPLLNYGSLTINNYAKVIVIVVAIGLLIAYLIMLIFISLFTESIYPRSKFYLHGHSQLTKMLIIIRTFLSSSIATEASKYYIINLCSMVNEIVAFLECTHSNICRWKFSIILTTVSISVTFWQNAMIIIFWITKYSINYNAIAVTLLLIAITTYLINTAISAHSMTISQGPYRLLTKKGTIIYIHNILSSFMKYNISTKNRAILFNFLQYHCHHCKIEKCECQSTYEWIYNYTSIKGSISRDGTEQKIIMGEIKSQWTTLLNVMLFSLINEVSYKLEVRYMYSSFLKIFVKNYYKAYDQVMQCIELKGNKIQEVMLTTHLARIKYAIGKKERVAKIINVEIDQLLYFENKICQFKSVLLEFTQLSNECCDRVISSFSYIKPLLVICNKMIYKIKEIYSIYSIIVNIYPQHLESHIAYAEFLHLVTNDQYASSAIFEKITQIRDSHLFGRKLNFNEEIEYFSPTKIGIAIISTQSINFGYVVFCNKYCAKIFEREVDELLHHNVNTIMPHLFAENHDKAIAEFLENGMPFSIGHINVVVGILKSGMIIPLLLTVKSIPTYTNRMFFLGFIINDRQMIYKKLKGIPSDMIKDHLAIALLNSNFKVEGICKRFSKLIGLPKQFGLRSCIFNESMAIEALFPQFDKTLYNKIQNVHLFPQSILSFINTDIFLDTSNMAQIESIKHSSDLMVSVCSLMFALKTGLTYYLIFISCRDEYQFIKNEKRNASSENSFRGLSVTSTNSTLSYSAGSLKSICASSVQPRFLRALKFIMMGQFLTVILCLVLNIFLPITGLKKTHSMFSLASNILESAVLQMQIGSILMIEAGKQNNILSAVPSQWHQYSTEYNMKLLESYMTNHWSSTQTIVANLLNVPDIFSKSLVTYQSVNDQIGSSTLSILSMQQLLTAKYLNLLNHDSMSSDLYYNFTHALPLTNNYSDSDSDLLWVLLNSNTLVMDPFNASIEYFSDQMKATLKKQDYIIMVMAYINIVTIGILQLILIPIIVSVQSFQRRIITSVSKIKKSQLLTMKDNYNKFIKENSFGKESSQTATNLKSIISSKAKDETEEKEKEQKEEKKFLDNQLALNNKITLSYRAIVMSVIILSSLLLVMGFTNMLILQNDFTKFKNIYDYCFLKEQRSFYLQVASTSQQRDLALISQSSIPDSNCQHYFDLFLYTSMQLMQMISKNLTLFDIRFMPLNSGPFCSSAQSILSNELYLMCNQYNGGEMNQGIELLLTREFFHMEVNSQFLQTKNATQATSYVSSPEYVLELIISNYLLQPFLVDSNHKSQATIFSSISIFTVRQLSLLAMWLILNGAVFVLLFITVLKWFVKNSNVTKGILLILPEDIIKQLNDSGSLNSALLN